MCNDNILVYGGCVLDNLFKIPQESVQGGVVYATSYAMSCGGKGANQAVMASMILDNNLTQKKNQIFFCTQIGEDVFGSIFRQQFNKLKCMNQQFVVVKPDYSTALSSIYINDQRENALVIYYDLKTELMKLFLTRQFQECLVKEISILLIQMDFCEESSLILMKQFRKINDDKFIILNAAPIRKNTSFKQFIHLSHIVIFNEIEFVHYCMEEKASDIEEWEISLKEKKFKNLTNVFERISKNILSIFPERKILIVTLGEDGILLFDGLNQLVKYMPLDRKSLESIKFIQVDATGAGDAFVGSLASIILQTGFHKSFFDTNYQSELSNSQIELLNLVETASLIASSTVKRLGTQVSYLPFQEMEDGVIKKIKSNFV
ncbi:hypothetical protein SNEBB_002020 [Seison nebaliae]|nr:hypothetical protein SNEBB_002020 [Seison nebaliae]